VRKDAKIALCVILALMVLVVVIWGRSPRPDDELAMEPASSEPYVVAAPPSKPAAPDADLADLDGARRAAPAAPPVEHSSLFAPDLAMMNQFQPADRAVVTHDPAVAAPAPVALRQDDARPRPPAPPADPASAKAQPAAGKTHVVEKGDSYIKIAQKYYGDSSHWRELETANKIPATALRVGQKLVIPPLAGARPSLKTDGAAPAPQKPPTAAPAAPAPPASTGRTYVVKKGESFYSIARSVYRDGGKWQKLYEHNRTRLPEPKKPTSLRAGMVIEIPPQLASAL